MGSENGQHTCRPTSVEVVQCRYIFGVSPRYDVRGGGEAVERAHLGHLLLAAEGHGGASLRG
eukprot:4869703-Pyramimonas_sp.AAC.1